MSHTDLDALCGAVRLKLDTLDLSQAWAPANIYAAPVSRQVNGWLTDLVP
jgi:hypothetical protein